MAQNICHDTMSSHGTCQLGDNDTLNASPFFDSYRSVKEFAPREPNLATMESEDELDDLSDHPEVISVQIAPQADASLADAEPSSDVWDERWLGKDEGNKYLWLVRIDDVKMCLEFGELGRSRSRRRLAHTNLSGNSAAHCGGELWFKDHDAIYLNGCSGRFRPNSAEELKAIVDCYRAAGFRVCCFGWDDGTGMPKRTLRKGEILWQ